MWNKVSRVRSYTNLRTNKLANIRNIANILSVEQNICKTDLPSDCNFSNNLLNFRCWLPTYLYLLVNAGLTVNSFIHFIVRPKMWCEIKNSNPKCQCFKYHHLIVEPALCFVCDIYFKLASPSPSPVVFIYIPRVVVVRYDSFTDHHQAGEAPPISQL